MAAYGVSEIWSSGSDSTAGRRFALGAPVAGFEKWVVGIKGEAAAPAIVSSTGAAASIGGNSIAVFSTGATNKQWLFLLGANTTNWYVLGHSTDVTFTAT
jgi:hypothetical protein